MSRKGGRAGLPKKGKWPPRGTGKTVLTYPCPSQVCFGGSKGCARATGEMGGSRSGVGIVFEDGSGVAIASARRQFHVQSGQHECAGTLKGNAEPFHRNASFRAAVMGRQAFGTRMVFRETFCVIISTSSSRIESMEFIDRGAAPFIYSGEK